jgi:hypothetical protein
LIWLRFCANAAVLHMLMNGQAVALKSLSVPCFQNKADQAELPDMGGGEKQEPGAQAAKMPHDVVAGMIDAAVDMPITKVCLLGVPSTRCCLPRGLDRRPNGQRLTVHAPG